MRVLYDHQIFTLQDYGGISRIYTELLKPDIAINKYIPRLLLKLSNNHYLTELNNVKYHSFFPDKYIPRKVQLMNFINKQNSIHEIKKQAYDIFHPTYYNPYFIKHLNDKPFVVTFLDMIHERFSSQYPELAQDKKIYADKKTVLERASSIIAISDSTKKDIITYFNVDEAKISVIHLATSLQHTPAPSIVEGSYLLFVGRRERYKNFLLLIKSIHPLLKEYKNLKVICAGGGVFVEEEQKLLYELGLTTQVLQMGFNTDEVLSNLYSNALAFVFPSLYEGFGIPVLEAFACKCPVVVSNISSLPEVAGNAAAYIDPTDETSILTTVKKVIEDEAYRNELIELGTKRNSFFSWQKNRNETEKLYQKLI